MGEHIRESGSVWLSTLGVAGSLCEWVGEHLGSVCVCVCVCVDVLFRLVYSTTLTTFFFTTIAVTTIVTAVRLRRVVQWRQSSTSSASVAVTSSFKEIALTKTLVVTSVLFIVCRWEQVRATTTSPTLHRTSCCFSRPQTLPSTSSSTTT